MERAREAVSLGLVGKGPRKQVVTNPAWRIYRDALMLLRAYAMEFGLTPASRSQVRALPASPRPQD